MQIVTLTSDWSKEDYYKSSLICALLSISIDIKLVTVTNNIKQFNVIEGCFILKHSFFHYPKGTIHLLAVNSELNDDQNFIIVKYKDHWFVSPDDGRFSLLIGNDEKPNIYLQIGRASCRERV